MNKRQIGYIIELNPELRKTIYAYTNDFRKAIVFSTREKARENKRAFSGLGSETIYQTALTRSGRPVRIIKKVR